MLFSMVLLSGTSLIFSANCDSNILTVNKQAASFGSLFCFVYCINLFVYLINCIYMTKKILTFLFFNCFVSIICLAQSDQSSLTQSGFLYDKFTDGLVKLKSGLNERVTLNYNVFEQSIVYLQNGQQMTITNTDDVDTVYLQQETFIPVSGKFYKLASYTPVNLLISYEAKAQHMVASSDHVSTAKKDQNTVNNTVTGVYSLGTKKNDVTYTCIMTYWLKNGANMYRANSEKQVAKVFPEKADAIRKYAKDNKVDFRSIEQVTQLITFAQQ
jgi:hypothetical protein